VIGSMNLYASSVSAVNPFGNLTSAKRARFPKNEIAFIGASHVMALPAPDITKNFLSFDILIPNSIAADAVVFYLQAATFGFIKIYWVNASKFLTAVIQDDLGNGITLNSADWTPNFNAYHNFKLTFSGKTFTTFVDNVQVATNTTPGSVTISQMTTSRFFAALDATPTVYLPDGTKVKNINGLYRTGKMFTDIANTTLATNGSAVASIQNGVGGMTYWTQATPGNRPQVNFI
jgi:hypothetical protein